MLKKVGILAGLALVALAAWGGTMLWQYSQADKHLADAESYLEDERWREARSHLRQVLVWEPNHPQANLMMAEALTRDPLITAPGDEEAGVAVVLEAIGCLERISDESEEASEAHLVAGRLRALQLLQPSKGIEHMRRAVELDPNNVEAHYWIWKFNELIGRPHTVVEDIWQTIDLSPPERRPELLRQWYMGEFFAQTSTQDMEVQMGLLRPDEPPTNTTVANRYLTFSRSEPDSTAGYVALARWFLSQGAPEDCKEQLDLAIKNAEEPLEDPLLISTLIQALDDLGEIDKAGPLLEKWPGEKSGYDYWRAKALVEHKLNNDLDAAIEGYRNAIKFWPGALDWRTWNLLSTVLRENGDIEEAAQVAERSNEIERLMRTDIQSTLRQNLGFLDQPEGLKDVVRFYRDLKLNREADAWQAVVDSLESKE